jgi:D-alanine-D-alanine ligase
MPQPLSVVVLGGGPDHEREVSLESSAAVAQALASRPAYRVDRRIIDRLDADQLARIPGDVIVPVLHGQWGEGGPLQDLLEASGRAYVGCRPKAARLAMDKILSKIAAIKIGVPAPRAGMLHPTDPACPLDFPCVVKPVHEGSTIGVHLVFDEAQWRAARRAALEDRAANPGRIYMVERYIAGREVTAGVLAPNTPECVILPLVEIKPSSGFYDYQAKYTRDDTVYEVAPKLPPGVEMEVRTYAQRLVVGMGIRHLCRIDFRIDPIGAPWVLEVNTMPGFTSHSLLPKAAAHAGIDFPSLCAKLVDLAWNERPVPTS